jgi:chemotaxis protein MotB
VLTEAERRAALLATANAELADERALSAESQRRLQALNEQVAALRTQLGSLQSLLDEAANATRPRRSGSRRSGRS